MVILDLRVVFDSKPAYLVLDGDISIMGTIFVDNLEPQSGTSLTLGASGDSISLASGATQSGLSKLTTGVNHQRYLTKLQLQHYYFLCTDVYWDLQHEHYSNKHIKFKNCYNSILEYIKWC